MSAASLSSLRVTFAPAAAGLALGLIAWAILFYPECRAAVGVWQSSDTYGHCFLILPMAAFLAWDRRAALQGVPPHPLPWLALLAAPVAAVWLLAERLGIMEGRQLAAIAGLDVLFLAVLGWPLFRRLLAPLLFLVFLVPFGAFATPALQDFTAAFIVGGLNLLGIANFATDRTIEISAGVFYVAEACAGLRFLIAAVAFGVFYALLTYRSPGRRVLFIAASVLVPIVANGFRALGIVVLGAVLGSAEAAAADHVIYGWVFFSFVMLLLVAGGMPFREAPPGPSPTQPGLHPLHPRSTGSVWAAAAVAVVLASGPAVAAVFTARITPASLTELPRWAVPPGCAALAGPSAALPAVSESTALLCDGRQLTVTIQAFPARWTADRLNRERRRLTGEFAAEETTVTPLPTISAANGVWSLVRTTGPNRAVAASLWIDGAPAMGGLAGRLRQARDSILGAAHAPILVTVAIEEPARRNSADHRATVLLQRFVDAQSELTSELARIATLNRPDAGHSP